MDLPELTYANHDPALCLAPGLFQSLPKRKGVCLTLRLTYAYNADTKMEFTGPALGVGDMRVLQCLLAMASVSKDNREIITHAATGAGETELRTQLKLTGAAEKKTIVGVQAKINVLRNEMGYSDLDSGGAYRATRESVERMCAVSITVQHNDETSESYRLLSKCSSAETGVLHVAFNPRLSAAILAPHKKKSYSRINMKEVRGLATDAARLLHQRLHWLPTDGEGRVIKLETLCNYAWPAEVNENAMRARRDTLAEALGELVGVGWHVVKESQDAVRIWRPATARRAIPGLASESASVVAEADA